MPSMEWLLVECALDGGRAARLHGRSCVLIPTRYRFSGLNERATKTSTVGVYRLWKAHHLGFLVLAGCESRPVDVQAL